MALLDLFRLKSLRVALSVVFRPTFLIGGFATLLLVALCVVAVLLVLLVVVLGAAFVAFLVGTFLVVASLAGVFFFGTVLGPRLGGALVTLLLVTVFLGAVLEAAAFFVALFGFDVRSVPGNSSSYRTRGGGGVEFAERVLKSKMPGTGGLAFLGSISPESKECPVEVYEVL